MSKNGFGVRAFRAARAVDEGVTSIRLTGGEPLIRPDIVEIVARINALPTPPRINLTTNALKLAI